MDVRHYLYRVLWSEEDQEYVGLCAEFPSLSWLDATQEGALKGIVRVVGEAVADMASTGETPPAPLSDRLYSGKLQLRIPPDRHRMLAMKAAEAGVSLNRYISDRLVA